MIRYSLPLGLFVLTALPAFAQDAEQPYAVERGVKGVVDLYDLSSVKPTPGGFSIVDVVAAKRFPHVFGPTAYRVNTETYRCGQGVYDITSVIEYDDHGHLIHALTDAPHGGMEVVANTASSEMYNRFCPANTGGKLPGLAPTQTVRAAGAYAAYLLASKMLASS